LICRDYNTSLGNGGTIFINFCRSTITKCEDLDGTSYSTYAAYFSPDGLCYPLTSERSEEPYLFTRTDEGLILTFNNTGNIIDKEERVTKE